METLRQAIDVEAGDEVALGRFWRKVESASLNPYNDTNNWTLFLEGGYMAVMPETQLLKVRRGQEA